MAHDTDLDPFAHHSPRGMRRGTGFNTDLPHETAHERFEDSTDLCRRPALASNHGRGPWCRIVVWWDHQPRFCCELPSRR